jgi:hypothetical protein
MAAGNSIASDARRFANLDIGPAPGSIETVIVGTKFRGAQAVSALRELRPGQEIRLVRENHPKDANAIQCHALGLQLGYVPRVANPRIAQAMDAGAKAIAEVTERAIVFDSGLIKREPKILVRWA